MKALSAIAITLVLLTSGPAVAQSLGGSPASMNRQEREAILHEFTFMESRARVERFVNAGLIERLEGNGNYDLHDVSYPYARPAVKMFVERLSRQFQSGCGEKLTVTSLTRPLSEQPSNSHSQSVHPTGMAVDLRVPRTGRCREWLNRVLLSLEGTGVLEATRERNPAHYHIAIYPNQYQRYVDNLERDVREYIVRRGDVLAQIARQTGTTVSAITSVNGLRSDLIHPGQVLRIPD